MLRSIALGLALMAAPAGADGFAIQDPSAVEVDVSVFEGGTFSKAVVERGLIVFCDSCEDDVQVSIEWSNETNQFMTAYLSGQTTLDVLDAQCKTNVPDCVIVGFQHGPSVGWKMTSDTATELVLFRDPQILAVRSDAPDPDLAIANLNMTIETLIPQIVGSDP